MGAVDVALSPDGGVVYIVTENEAVRRFTPTPQTSGSPLPIPDGSGAEMSPDGSLFAFDDEKTQSIVVANALTGQAQSGSRGAAARFRSVTFSNDGSMLAAAGTIDRHRVGSRDRPGARDSVHQGDTDVYGLGFSADDSLLYTAGPDRALLGWDLEGSSRFIPRESASTWRARRSTSLPHRPVTALRTRCPTADFRSQTSTRVDNRQPYRHRAPLYRGCGLDARRHQDRNIGTGRLHTAVGRKQGGERHPRERIDHGATPCGRPQRRPHTYRIRRLHRRRTALIVGTGSGKVSMVDAETLKPIGKVPTSTRTDSMGVRQPRPGHSHTMVVAHATPSPSTSSPQQNWVLVDTMSGQVIKQGEIELASSVVRAPSHRTAGALPSSAPQESCGCWIWRPGRQSATPSSSMTIKALAALTSPETETSS